MSGLVAFCSLPALIMVNLVLFFLKRKIRAIKNSLNKRLFGEIGAFSSIFGMSFNLKKCLLIEQNVS